jgi:glycosyltransferase involved in cell wall biosynthesis
LADILALLVRDDPRWRLDVCGDGPLEAALRGRLRELGVADHARLLGHVSLADGLLERYRESHAFLHVSFTEGLPQVLTEAFAAGLPIVATDVGGVRDGTGDAALLVPPAQAEAAAAALRRLVTEPETRERLIRAGLHRVRDQTLEAESSRVAALLAGAAQPAASSR